MLTARCFYTTILIVVYKKPASFLQAQNGEITHLYFLFFMFFIHIYVICHSDKSSMTVIFRFSEIIIFSSFIFLFHASLHFGQQKGNLQGRKEGEEDKGVFPFSVLMYSKKSKACSSASADRECLCEQDFFMRFLMYALIIRWCLLQCFSQQVVNFEYFTKSILQFVLALR